MAQYVFLDVYSLGSDCSQLQHMPPCPCIILCILCSQHSRESKADILSLTTLLRSCSLPYKRSLPCQLSCLRSLLSFLPPFICHLAGCPTRTQNSVLHPHRKKQRTLDFRRSDTGPSLPSHHNILFSQCCTCPLLFYLHNVKRIAFLFLHCNFNMLWCAQVNLKKSSIYYFSI